jgi:predicted adenylyl cyclase CyaB
MIEVEKKFRLDEKQESILLEDAKLVGSKTNEDVYFDTDDFYLTKQDNWLRLRNGAFELKKRLHKLGHKLGTTAYDEITDEQKIRDFLRLQTFGSLINDLRDAGYKPFATIKKQRKSYTRGNFHIDLDVCDFGYELAEIELLVETEAEREMAQKKINEFALKIGLDQTPVRGKVIEYLLRFRPQHYQALVKAGVI